MNGETTKYYQYESSTSASITIPKSIAKAMNWSHKDELKVAIKSLNNYTGIFLFKSEKKVDVETTKYYQYESSTSASATIPKPIAKAMNWSHKDEIRVVIKAIDNHTGLFLFKP